MTLKNRLSAYVTGKCCADGFFNPTRKAVKLHG